MQPTGRPSRRTFLLSSVAIAAAGAFGISRFAKAGTIVGTPGKVSIHQFTDVGKSIGVVEMDKVVKSEDEWKKLLAAVPQADLTFAVTRTSVHRSELGHSFRRPLPLHLLR